MMKRVQGFKQAVDMSYEKVKDQPHYYTTNDGLCWVKQDTRTGDAIKVFPKELPVTCMFCKVECKQVWEEESEMWNPDTRSFDAVPPHVSHNCPNCRMSYQRGDE